MEKNIIKTRLWNLVHLFEDYITTGYRTTHLEFRVMPEENHVKEEVSLPAGEELEIIRQKIRNCTGCYLHYNRVNAVPGEGPENPDLFIVGTGPGEEEDAAAKPFCGESGEYLQKWLHAINLNISEDCFTCNIVRCRPPQNRDPRMEEIKACLPFLDKQIVLSKPKVILCLGRISGQVLTGKLTTSVTGLRNTPFSYKGIPVIVTYNPILVLKDQGLRKPVWEDLKRVQKMLEKRNLK